MAFFSRSLNNAQKSYPSVEKEAMAVVEAVKHWSHLLRKRRFTLITDQRSVAFMYDNKKKSKIKNTKILNWRMELDCTSNTNKNITFLVRFSLAPRVHKK